MTMSMSVQRVLALRARDLRHGLALVSLQPGIQDLRDQDPGARFLAPVRVVLHEVRPDARADRRVLKARDELLPPALAHPEWQAGVEVVGARRPRILVRRHVEAFGASPLD